MKNAAIIPFAVLLAGFAAASVPQLIDFQGKLAYANGTAYTGSQTVNFSIYNAATGGSALWSEVQTVTAENGNFDVLLGGVTGLSGVQFNQTLYLGIKRAGASEMAPRLNFTQSPFAMSLGGVVNVNGTKVGVGTTNPTQALDVVGNVKGTQLCIGSDCRSSWPSGGPASYTNCEWIDGGQTSGATYSNATCPSGKYTAGFHFWYSSNTDENIEEVVTPDFAACRRPNQGSYSHAYAYCCNFG